MKKLITLRGNSGSGKTTIARALQEKFGKNTMLLSQDVIRRDILKTNDGAGTRANDVLIMLLEYEQTLTPDMMQNEIIDRICADLERLDT